MIIYNYPISPFCEKIRLMAGYCEVKWYSLEVKSSPPRPVIDELVHGYRKMPVVQKGSDIYCDSKLIAKEFFPELFLEANDQQAGRISYLEKDVFYTCLNAIPVPKLLSYWIKEFSFAEFFKTVIDRSSVAKEFENVRIPQKQALELWDKHLSTLDSELNKKFLFGDQPSAADFSAYHLIWFYLKSTKSELNKNFANLCSWYNRMRSYGHGKYSNVTNDFALLQAENTYPKPISPSFQTDHRIGEIVLISPDDYFKVPTKGILVGSTDYSWIIKREIRQYGTVHIHFPKEGFQVVKAP